MEPGEGIEPSSAGSKPALLTAAPARYLVRKVRFELTRLLRHHGLSMTRLPVPSHAHMVGRAGFEPAVFLMSRIYSALASASLHTDPYWLQGRDLNPHNAAYEAVALPDRLPCMVLEEGLEPSACGLSIRCSAN